jgi:hypothetical protein
MAWDELVAGGLEVFCVPSYPAQIVEEPFVRDLAIKLRSCISASINPSLSLPDRQLLRPRPFADSRSRSKPESMPLTSGNQLVTHHTDIL